MTLTERFNKLRFNWAIRAIEGTSPVLRGKVAYTALSMVHHRDVLPYLLALKSTAWFLAPAQVVMVADRRSGGSAAPKHFLDYVRFSSGLYVDVARDVAGQLRRPGAPAPEHVA